MKKVFILLLAIVMFSSLVLSGCASQTSATTPVRSSTPTASKAANTTILKVSVGIPDGDPMVEGLKTWSDAFNKAANGKFEMRVFSGGSLLNSGDIIDAVRNNMIEIAHGNIGSSSNKYQSFGVAEVPYLLNNYEANYEFLKLVYDYYDNILQTKFNQKMLALWGMGFTELYSSKKPIKVMEDLKGLNVGAYSTLGEQCAKALGGSPVLMSFQDEAAAFQKGLLDASLIGAAGGMAFNKYWEFIKYYTNSSRAGIGLYVTMNLDMYKKMSPDLQKVMVDQGQKYQEDMNVAMKNFSYVWAIDQFKKGGMEIYNLPQAERARWKTANQPVMDEYFKSLGNDAQFLRDAADKANSKFPYTGS
jgi:TRAP-type C4-dicarboxylate transport system substrate-binding protein